MADAVSMYLLMARTWTRASWQYPGSVITLTAASLITSAMEAVEIAIIFNAVPQLGGFGLTEVAFLYGSSGLSLAIADVLVGQIDKLGMRVRRGDVDVMLVRPVPLLVQLAADEFSVRRFGKVAQAAVVLGLGLSAIPVQWDVLRILLVPTMVIAGVAIYASIWVVCASLLFAAPDASEMINALTYGGNYLTQHPLTIYSRQVVLGLTVIVPLAFVNWEPSLLLLRRPDPLGLPWVTGLASPIVAVLSALVAAACWRRGVRGYRSTGS